MKEINRASQLATVERVLVLVERAATEWGDAASLDVLEGPEGQNATEVEARLSDALACLRALKRQLGGA